MLGNSTPNHVPYQSTLAPSEKHLEDWLCSPDLIEYGLFERVVGRQIHMQSGICDILATRPIMHQKTTVPCMLTLTVVEAKKGELTTEALAQCLRYMRDLRGILLHVRYPSNEDDKHLYNNYRNSGMVDLELGIPFEISGMLIGHSMNDKNLRTACDGAGIEVWSYEYANGRYSLDLVDTGENVVNRHEAYAYESNAEIGIALHEVLQRRLAVQLEHEADKS